MICGLSILEGVDGELARGSVLSARCTLELANDQGQWSTGGILLGGQLLRGATLMLKIGVVAEGTVLWRDLGVFQIERATCLNSSGLHVGDSQTDNELLLQSAMMHFVINGERVSTIASDYHRFGNMEIRTSSSVGGIVIQSVQ